MTKADLEAELGQTVAKRLQAEVLPGDTRFAKADLEAAAALAGEGDEVAARGPGGLRIAALAEGDALAFAAGGRHHVKLLLAAAVVLTMRSFRHLAPVRKAEAAGLPARAPWDWEGVA